MMKKQLLIAVSVVCLSAQAQVKFSADAWFGYGKLVNWETTSNAVYKSLETYYSPSFGLGVTARKNITDQFFLGSGLSYSYLKGRQRETVDISSNTGEITTLTSNKTYEVHYLQVPITAGYQFGRFGVEGGVQLGFLLGNNESLEVRGKKGEPYPTTQEGELLLVMSRGNNLARLDGGLTGRLTVKLTEKLGLYTGVYAGLLDSSNKADQGLLTDVYGTAGEPERLKHNLQFKLGISFDLN